MPGMHGNYTAVTAMQKADLLVALGSRFDDRVTGKLAGFAPHAKIVHVDIDPAEIGKNRAVDVPIVGDCKDVIGKLAAELAKRQDEAGGVPDRGPWLHQLAEWKETYPYRYDQQPDGDLKPQYCVERLNHFADDDTILVSGVGQHQMYASQYWRFERPRHWVNSGGLGTMGFAVPAAMGAKVGQPEQARGRDRRRRLLPDDRAGARHERHREDPVRHGDPEQRLPGHGAPVAGAVLRRALLGRVARPERARLREARRGLRRRWDSVWSHPTRSMPRSRRRSRSPTAAS